MTDISTFTASLGWQAPYIGLPYDFHGYDRRGLSCWGLVCLAWKEQAGVLIPTFAEKLPKEAAFSPARTRAVNALIVNQINIMTPINRPRPLCAVQMRKGAALSHIGLYAFGGWIVHADEEANGGAGAVVQTRMEQLSFQITGYYWPSPALFSAQSANGSQEMTHV